MRAIILAGGFGTRLHPITDKKPKALVMVNNKPILGHTIEALITENVTNIVISVGYCHEQIINYCGATFPKINFTFVNNTEHETTNNMYGLYLCRDYFDQDLLVMNGDLVFDSGIIKLLMNSKGSRVAVDKGRYLDEAMKIVVSQNKIERISKKITPQESYGSSIDIYRLEQTDLPAVSQELERIISTEGKNHWTEVMLDNLFQLGSLIAKPLPIGRHRWFEIDNFDDLSQAEILFNKHLPLLKHKKVFFADRDGTLTLGSGLISGSSEFINIVHRNNKQFVVMTNNSSKTSTQHWQEFVKKGLPVSRAEVLVSLDAALDYLQSSGYKRVFWMANKKVSTEIKSQGFHFDKKNPQILLLTWDTEVTYSKLRRFSLLVQSGLPYFATHPDITCPSPKGPIPDIGTLIKVIELTTGKTPDMIFGKPNKAFISQIVKKHGYKNSEIVVMGDRLYTDIALSQDSQITSILVLTGETNRAEYEFSNIKADIVVPSVKDLIPFMS